MAKHGTIFFVAGPNPLKDYAYFPNSPQYHFLKALPKFRVVKEVKFGEGFAGMFPFPVGLFELRFTETPAH